MHVRFQLAFALCLLVIGALAQVTEADLPSCSLKCFDPLPPHNSSSSACRYKPETDFEWTFSPCFYDSCSVRDALTALNVTSIICGVPDRDISVAMRIFVVVATLFASLIIGCRVILKYQSLAGKVGWDDWAIVVAVIVTMDAAVGQYIAAHYGLGRDAWKVPFEDQEKIFKAFYASTAGYKLGNMFARMSILLLYLRIFSAGGFRRVVLAAIAANVAIGVGFTFADAFQCRPVSLFWNMWDGEHEGTCLSISTITWAHSVLNILLDVAALAMAAWMVKRLNMNAYKKASVIGMFVLGSAITLVTFLRLQAVPPLANTRNRTWSVAPLAYWSAIEMAAGLVCACLPALKKLRYIFRGKEKSTYNSGSGDYARDGSRSAKEGSQSAKDGSSSASPRSAKSSSKEGMGQTIFLKTFNCDSSPLPSPGINNSVTELVEARPASQES